MIRPGERSFTDQGSQRGADLIVRQVATVPNLNTGALVRVVVRRLVATGAPGGGTDQMIDRPACQYVGQARGEVKRDPRFGVLVDSPAVTKARLGFFREVYQFLDEMSHVVIESRFRDGLASVRRWYDPFSDKREMPTPDSRFVTLTHGGA